ncbi:FkbM family methyltransferase [Niastella koreensis]|uniref:FkbM family methyltransferase n=1 Tax=Niastella koreensis TaxID=354356 RepID=UPI0013FD328F|nr:FkbM family methyltransferase [Niastella koreensis]
MKRERDFVKTIVSKDSLVYDIGANMGNKTQLFRSLGANVITIEPDSTNYALLVNRFGNDKNVKVLQYAISDSIGVTNFYMDEPGSAYNTLSVKWKESLEDSSVNRWKTIRKFDNVVEVKTVTIDYLIKEYGVPKYIKIDVEGHELPCIKGLSSNIEVISFEANLPEFKSETLNIITCLRDINKNVKFNYQRDDESFELSKHISYDEFYKLLESTDIRYMEVYSFM